MNADSPHKTPAARRRRPRGGLIVVGRQNAPGGLAALGLL